MSLYDKFRWTVLDLAACYHGIVCALRMAGGAPSKAWLHDRPDWFVKLVAIKQPDPKNTAFRRLHQQAVIELDFRRATGVSK